MKLWSTQARLVAAPIPHVNCVPLGSGSVSARMAFASAPPSVRRTTTKLCGQLLLLPMLLLLLLLPLPRPLHSILLNLRHASLVTSVEALTLVRHVLNTSAQDSHRWHYEALLLLVMLMLSRLCLQSFQTSDCHRKGQWKWEAGTCAYRCGERSCDDAYHEVSMGARPLFRPSREARRSSRVVLSYNASHGCYSLPPHWIVRN